MAQRREASARQLRPAGARGVPPSTALQRPPRFLATVAVYGLLVLILSIVLLSDLVFRDLLGGVRVAVARGAAATLSLAGVPISSHGETITGPGTPLQIVNECTGVDATILLVCAIAVFPAGWREKLIGIGVAAAIMMGVNFVRVLALVYVGSYLPDWLEVSHLYVWPVAVILAGVGTLLFWAERIAAPRAP